MAQREKMFKKPSYRVYKRILERYIRLKCDLLHNELRSLSLGMRHPLSILMRIREK